MTRYKIIANPTSGKGSGERDIPIIEQALKAEGLDFELVRTERPWHAAELARQAVRDGFDVVAASGGDGTANEVINGLVAAQKAGEGHALLGVIPAGRGNDFAFGMGAPTDLQESLRALAALKTRTVDVGWVQGELYPDGRYLGNGVGIGFDAMVGFVAAELKLTGFLAYGVSAIKTMLKYYNAPLLKIELDDEIITQPAIMVSMMNGRRMGGGFMMAPDSKQDDGKFDVCIVGQVSRPHMLTLIPKFMNGTQAADPAVQFKRSQKITITALEGTLPAHADGETLCTQGHQLHLEMFPHLVEIIIKP